MRNSFPTASLLEPQTIFAWEIDWTTVSMVVGLLISMMCVFLSRDPADIDRMIAYRTLCKGQTADVARQTATTLDSWLRNAIETQPYTTAVVALGIGWLLGRMHRPL